MEYPWIFTQIFHGRFHGISIETFSMEFPWIFAQIFHGRFHGISTEIFSMEFPWIFTQIFHGRFHGISMDFFPMENLQKFRGIPWNFHGIPWNFCRFSMEIPWILFRLDDPDPTNLHRN